MYHITQPNYLIELGNQVAFERNFSVT